MAQREASLVASRIKAARVRAGLSHDRLGALVGTSRQHLIRLEKGIHAPRDGMLARIAEATGQPLSFFESDEDDEESDPVSDLFKALRRVVRDELLNATTEPTALPAKSARPAPTTGG